MASVYRHLTHDDRIIDGSVGNLKHPRTVTRRVDRAYADSTSTMGRHSITAPKATGNSSTPGPGMLQSIS
jgi:hypothetical protein